MVYEARSRSCRPVDKKIGRVTLNWSKRHLGGSGTCETTPHEERNKKI